MTDRIAASLLRELFAASAGTYPSLIQEATVMFECGAGSQFKVKTKTPASAANLLQHIYNHDGEGSFNRVGEWDAPNPLYFRMYKRVRLKADNKEHVLLAFNLTWRDLDKPAHLWLSDPRMTDYYWQGDERVENMPPFTCEGPTIPELINALRKAGNDWHNVNLMKKPKGSHLQLVERKP